MQKNTSDIIKELSGAVVALDEVKAVRLCKEGLDSGIKAEKLVSKGLAGGMAIAGDWFEKGIFFIPELLLASDVMYAGMAILKPALVGETGVNTACHGKIVIGVIEGDVHDIGKNLVKIMLEAAGYQLIDLGSDVSAKRFLDTAVKEGADMICLSSLVSTTMLHLGSVISLLVREGVRERFMVMVGGACVTADYARYIGADGFAPNAPAAVRRARILLKKSVIKSGLTVFTGTK